MSLLPVAFGAAGHSQVGLDYSNSAPFSQRG